MLSVFLAMLLLLGMHCVMCDIQLYMNDQNLLSQDFAIKLFHDHCMDVESLNVCDHMVLNGVLLMGSMVLNQVLLMWIPMLHFLVLWDMDLV